MYGVEIFSHVYGIRSLMELLRFFFYSVIRAAGSFQQSSSTRYSKLSFSHDKEKEKNEENMRRGSKKEEKNETATAEFLSKCPKGKSKLRPSSNRSPANGFIILIRPCASRVSRLNLISLPTAIFAIFLGFARFSHIYSRCTFCHAICMCLCNVSPLRIKRPDVLRSIFGPYGTNSTLLSWL